MAEPTTSCTDLEALLPPIDDRPTIWEPDFYGASREVAASLGLSKIPKSYAGWVHGAHWETPTEAIEIGWKCRRGWPLLVFNEEQRDLVRAAGWSKAEAVGAPILYATENLPEVERVPGSVLCFPPHTLSYTKVAVDEQKYISELAGLRDHFGEVVVSLHAHSIKESAWRDALSAHGVRWVRGASLNDRNALRRMATLFQRFETVTSNNRGSHLPYAAHFGCKISFWGDWISRNEASYEASPFSQKFPEVIPHRVQLAQEDYNRERYPFLFAEPWNAKLAEEWGSEVLGLKFKRSPQEVASILGWGLPTQLKNALTIGLPRAVKRWCKIPQSKFICEE